MVLAKSNTLNHSKWLFRLENIQGMYTGICFAKVAPENVGLPMLIL